jgi:hypothetical protein
MLTQSDAFAPGINQIIWIKKNKKTNFQASSQASENFKPINS